MKHKVKVLSTTFLLGALLLTGCGNGENTENNVNTQEKPSGNVKPVATVEDNTGEESPAPTPAEQQAEQPAEEFVSPEGYPVTPKQAADLFLEEYPGAKLTEIKLDHSDSHGYLFKVEGVTEGKEHELNVDTHTAAILKVETEADDDDKSDEVFTYTDEIVEWTEAMKKALEKVGATAYAEEWELKKENGKVVYEFDIINDGDSVDVTVDALTGEVLELDD